MTPTLASTMGNKEKKKYTKKYETNRSSYLNMGLRCLKWTLNCMTHTPTIDCQSVNAYTRPCTTHDTQKSALSSTN